MQKVRDMSLERAKLNKLAEGLVPHTNVINEFKHTASFSILLNHWGAEEFWERVVRWYFWRKDEMD